MARLCCVRSQSPPAPGLMRCETCKILLLTDWKVRLDRIDLRNSGQHGGLTDQITDLSGSNAGDAVNQRTNFGESKIQLRLFDSGFSGLDGGLGGGNSGFLLLERLNIVIQLALRDGVRLSKRRVALNVDLGQTLSAPELARVGHSPALIGLWLGREQPGTVADRFQTALDLCERRDPSR